jgi:Tfp pilus assembly protein PilZ
MTEMMQKRESIRHPADIPLSWTLGDVVVRDTEYLRNISVGGLAFSSTTRLAVGADIDIAIPIRKPELHIRGIVVWCTDKEDGTFDVGVQFKDAEAKFRMRMVEQVCHIEHFKKEVLRTEGRTLTSEQAAMEWIRRFAKDFPSLD